MPIPTQNEILVPFLETLAGGQPHTRDEILFELARRFDLSEAELTETTGPHITMINRVGWCDAYFGKAGFITKEKHPKDNLRDVFRITPVGQMQLQRHADRIDVGYLQSFYRGNVYRGAGSADTTSDAELTLFEQLDKLEPPFTVFHSVTWFATKGRYGSVGEIDFLIAHPDHGVLVVEVKGGELSIEREGNRNQWYSRGHFGTIHEISDPCEQAERNRRHLQDYLATHQLTRSHRYALFPAVAAPDSVIGNDIRPDCPTDIFLDMRHMDALKERLLSIFAYWSQRADRANQQMDGQPAIDALVEALVPSRKLRPRIGDVFERERRRIEELTEQQFRVLRMLRQHRRATIIGGAGTGKTMLAMEKAQQLAEADMKVLFLAFNRGIVEWVDKQIGGGQIAVSTYHSLVGTLQYQTGFRRNQGMDWDEFTREAPGMLLEAAEYLRETDPDALWDAVIIDEAQDFDENMWIPITDLLRDPEEGILYIFFDDSQRIYTQISNVPIESDPLYLTDNCRNTQRIHTTMMPYAVPGSEAYCDGPPGRDVRVLPVQDEDAMRRELQRVLHHLVNEENVQPDEIIILTPKTQQKSVWGQDEILGNFVLTWDMETEMNMAICISTIYSFKGLESEVVILTELDRVPDDIGRQLIYVGLSRARHHAVVLGDLPDPNAFAASDESV